MLIVAALSAAGWLGNYLIPWGPGPQNISETVYNAGSLLLIVLVIAAGITGLFRKKSTPGLPADH